MIEIDYIAVLVATVAAYAVGALWYGFLFKKKWGELMGYPPALDHVRAIPALTPALSMTIGFFTTLLMVYVLAHFVVLVNIATIGGAIQLGFWVWLGFQLPLIAHQVLYENRKLTLFAINLSHQFVAMLVASIILVLL